MAGRKLSIGAVDIGGTKIATGLVNPSRPSYLPGPG